MLKAINQPNEVALIGPNVELNWEELISDCKKISLWLRENGVLPGDKVLLRLSPEAEITTMLAVLHEGGTSAHFAENLRKLNLAQMGFQYLITNQEGREINGVKNLVLNPKFLPTQENQLEIEPIDFESTDSTIRVIFSSGTTGTPKAVPISLGQTLSRMVKFEQTVIQGENFMSTLSYDVSLGYITAMADLLSGRRHFVAGPPDSALETASKFEVERLAISPIGLAQLTEAVARGTLSLDWSVRRIYTAGGPVSIELAAKASDTLGVELVSIYGSTEVGLVAVRKGIPSDATVAGEIMKEVEVQIVDETGAALPENQTGIVRLRVPWQATHYLGDLEKTEEHFQNGFFYPGDLGRVVDNQLFILGRTNLVMNLGGIKLDPLTIENFVRDEFGVQDVAMCVSEAHLRPVQIVLCSLDEVDEADLVARIETEFRLLGKVGISKLSALPRNSMGKLNRLLLAEMLGSDT